MNYKDWSSKLEKVLEQTDKETLYDFMRSYAETNQDLALALIEQFGREKSDDAKTMVEQCFLHPSLIGTRYGTQLDWRSIDEDLGKVMERSKSLRSLGDDLGAVLIARYVLTMTYCEYMADHFNLELTRGDGDYHTEEAMAMLRELLIDGDTIDYDTRKGLLKEIAEDTKDIKHKGWLCRLDFFLEDSLSVTMTRKGFIGYLNRKIDSSYGLYKEDYIAKLMSFLLKQNDEPAAIALLDKTGCSKARNLLIDYFVDRLKYDDAITILLNGDDGIMAFYEYKWDKRLIEILRLQGDSQKLISICRQRFFEAEYRWPYYEALKEAVPSEEWDAYLQQLLSDCDFHMDCDDTQLRLYKAEKLYDKFFPYFMKNNYVEVERWAEYGGLMTEEEQLQVADKLSDSIVEMAKRQNKRRDYRFVAEHVATFMKASPIAEQKGIELISRILDALPGRPALYDELMKIYSHR